MFLVGKDYGHFGQGGVCVCVCVGGGGGGGCVCGGGGGGGCANHSLPAHLFVCLSDFLSVFLG